VSLDTQKLRRLKGKSFDKLYADHAAKWREMVETARDYAQTCVGKNEKVRIGDIIEVIVNAIRIDPAFEKHTKDKGLSQKYWVTYFAEYVVEQVYPQPELKKGPK